MPYFKTQPRKCGEVIDELNIVLQIHKLYREDMLVKENIVQIVFLKVSCEVFQIGVGTSDNWGLPSQSHKMAMH